MTTPNSRSSLDVPSSPPRSTSKQKHHGDDGDDEGVHDGTPELQSSKQQGGSSRSKSKGMAKDVNAQLQIGKIRHLKKDDGEPLWRKDIQFDFLRAVFDDNTKVFTNSWEPETEKQNFADLYIDTMARSSKTSKVLRDKLLSDKHAAKGMAMVCLLVNIGRMNTTLNFFPEMRAQLRTYHAIPSLQAQQDPHAYKQLQDAPRLKSILKGGMEDRTEPNSLIKIKQSDVPRTNPVNLLFVICQSAFKIAELHFPSGQEFHDLLMKSQFSSQSRATAFLWLMWFYLESDFTEEGCEENPFGPGVDYGLNVANQGVPKLRNMTEAEEAAENVDTENEIEFGYEKKKLRHNILDADQVYIQDRDSKRTSRGSRPIPDDGPAILPRIRPSKQESDMDSTRSTPPPSKSGPRHGVMGSASRRGVAPLRYQIIDGSSPAPMSHHGGGGMDGIIPRKPRPPTAHQLAVEKHRAEQVSHILDRGLRKKQHKAKKLRRREGAIYRARTRTNAMSDCLAFDDSEDDHRERGGGGGTSSINLKQDDTLNIFISMGPGGLAQLRSEEDDFGEESRAYSASVRRASRRLKRWRDANLHDVVNPFKKKGDPDQEDQDGDDVGMNGHAHHDEDHDDQADKNHMDMNGDVTMEDAYDADEKADTTVLAMPGGVGGVDDDDDDDDDRQEATPMDDGSDMD